MTEIGHCNAGELVLTLGISNSGDSGSVSKSINVVSFHVARFSAISVYSFQLTRFFLVYAL